MCRRIRISSGRGGRREMLKRGGPTTEVGGRRGEGVEGDTMPSLASGTSCHFCNPEGGEEEAGRGQGRAGGQRGDFLSSGATGRTAAAYGHN